MAEEKTVKKTVKKAAKKAVKKAVKKAAKKTAKKTAEAKKEWRSWIDTPSLSEVRHEAANAPEEGKRHMLLVRSRIRTLEGMVSRLKRKDRAAALHILAWLWHVAADPDSLQRVHQYAEEAVRLNPNNARTWCFLSDSYYWAARRGGKFVPGETEITDIFGSVTVLTGDRRQKARIRAAVMKRHAAQSVRCMREAVKLSADRKAYWDLLRMGIAQENEAERRLARAESRPANVTPMKATGWRERLMA